MRVWVIQVGEPLPIEAGRPRVWRTGLLARQLARMGHEVLWWASTFEHRSKRHRYPEMRIVDWDAGPKVLLLHSPGYRANVSLGRLYDHWVLGREFRKHAATQPPPDVIHCGFPTIELSLEATRYGRAHGVPVVLDTRDMWPDIFVDAMPRALRPLARVALTHQFRQTREAFRLATAVSGHTPAFVEFGLRYAGRPAGPDDRAFPFAYPTEPPAPDEVAAAERFWDDRGVRADVNVPIVCFFGAFGAQDALDLETPIEAARLMAQAGKPVQVVMCGAGPRLESCRALAAGAANVVLPGWVGFPEIWTLMRRARAGILPYLPAKDFGISLPNKSIEYLSAALPVVTSLTGGYTEHVLQASGCMIPYEGRNPASLADAWSALFANPQEVERKSAAAGALFAREFSADHVYRLAADHLIALAAAHGTGATSAPAASSR